MGHPRRDAFEHFMFVALSSSMAASCAFLFIYSSSIGPDGQRRRLPRVNLDDKMDFGESLSGLVGAFGELGGTIGRNIGMGGQSDMAPASNSSPQPAANNGSSSGVSGQRTSEDATKTVTRQTAVESSPIPASHGNQVGDKPRRWWSWS